MGNTDKENKPVLKKTVVRLPADLLRRAKIAAVKRDSTLQALMTEALEIHLKGVRP
jgi:hypothetical protein